MENYTLIDSGHGKKLEQFGSVRLIRPCSQALWSPKKPSAVWKEAHAEFSREPKGVWREHKARDDIWHMILGGLKFKLQTTSFGHVGVFPEHSTLWPWIKDQIEEGNTLLNLFGYSGAVSLFAAKCGAQVTHLDASAGMVERARENAAINQLEEAPIRWIVDDVFKFLKREERRERVYDAIILDPPSFGRGSKGEVFKIEKDMIPLLDQVKKLLSKTPNFVLVTCHTPGITPLILKNILLEVFPRAKVECGELTYPASEQSLPGGIYGKCCFR